MVQQLRQELLSVYGSGLMHVNHTHLVSKGSTKLLRKSQILEAELTLDPSIQQAAPLIAQLNTDRTLATMLTLHIPQLRLESQAIKMQHNEGEVGSAVATTFLVRYRATPRHTAMLTTQHVGSSSKP